LVQRADFEAFKDKYGQEIQKSIDFIGQDFEFFIRRKAEILTRLVEQELGDPKKFKVLDVGCGIGLTDQHLTGHFKKVFGVDLSRGVVKKAAALNPKGSYKAYPGGKLPHPSNSMDVTFAICVLHHVEPVERDLFLSELARVTRKGGLVMIFEHNPLNPLTRVAVSRCDMDKDAHLVGLGATSGLLTSGRLQVFKKEYIFFSPWTFLSGLDGLLGWLPLGAQYFVAARK
jgi:SAM-dependent methyltransferase